MSAPARQQAANQRHQQPTQDAETLLQEMLERTWLDETIQKQASTIDQITAKFNDQMVGVGGKLAKAMIVAKGIAIMRLAITDAMVDLLMQLQGQQFGFMTDKTYNRETVKECACHAFLDGLFPFGNEWNIIGGRYMPVLNGWRRKVQEIPNLTDLTIDIGEAKPWGAFGLRVECSASWRIGDKAQSIRKTCSLKKDGGFSIDNADGKLNRKMLKAVYLAVCGNSFASLDEDELHAAAEQAHQTAASAPKANTTDRQTADLRLSDAVAGYLAAGFTKEDAKREHANQFGNLRRSEMNAAQLNTLADHFETLAEHAKQPVNSSSDPETDGRQHQDTPTEPGNRRGVYALLQLQIKDQKITPVRIANALIELGLRGEEETTPVDLMRLTDEEIRRLIDELAVPAGSVR